MDGLGNRVLGEGTTELSSSDKVLRYALSMAKAAARLGGSAKVILITKDMSQRIKANALELIAEDYLTQATNVDDLFCGYRIIRSSGELVDRYRVEDKKLPKRKTPVPGAAMAPSPSPPPATMFACSEDEEEDEVDEPAAFAHALSVEKEVKKLAGQAPAVDSVRQLRESIPAGYPAQDNIFTVPNEMVVLVDEADGAHFSLARYSILEPTDSSSTDDDDMFDSRPKDDTTSLRPAMQLTPVLVNRRAWNVEARGIQQALALELLLDPNVSLVTLVGQAGTGKTLLALAAGLELTVHQKLFKKILVTRPITPLGNDIGYLPGTKDDKMMSWMLPIFDNLGYITSQASKVMDQNPFGALGGQAADDDAPISRKKQRRRRNNPANTAARYRDKGYDVGTPPVDKMDSDAAPAEGGEGISSEEAARYNIKALLNTKIFMEAITFLRGRSIQEEFVIVDECQNVTPHEIKTILSRAGKGTKIVLCGDPYQIDNPYLDLRSNGLSYVVDRMRHMELHGHITLKHTVRSRLAKAAAEML